MRKAHSMAAIAIGIALSAPFTYGQAYSVQPSGGVVQEGAATAIPPEDQPTKDQLMKLFDAMRIRQQMATMHGMVRSMVEGQLREQMNAITSETSGSRLSPEQRARAQRVTAKYVEKSIGLYPDDEMLGDMATIYQRYLTREDVDAMIAFYSSSSGQHLLDAQPRIAQDFMPLVMQRVQERSKVLTAEMMKELNEVMQSPKPAPASPPKQ